MARVFYWCLLGGGEEMWKTLEMTEFEGSSIQKWQKVDFGNFTEPVLCDRDTIVIKVVLLLS